MYPLIALPSAYSVQPRCIRLVSQARLGFLDETLSALMRLLEQ